MRFNLSDLKQLLKLEAIWLLHPTFEYSDAFKWTAIKASDLFLFVVYATKLLLLRVLYQVDPFQRRILFIYKNHSEKSALNISSHADYICVSGFNLWSDWSIERVAPNKFFSPKSVSSYWVLGWQIQDPAQDFKFRKALSRPLIITFANISQIQNTFSFFIIHFFI